LNAAAILPMLPHSAPLACCSHAARIGLRSALAAAAPSIFRINKRLLNVVGIMPVPPFK
jgi:hypothetical protein